VYLKDGRLYVFGILSPSSSDINSNAKYADTKIFATIDVKLELKLRA
jgi:hypothetical protein